MYFGFGPAGPSDVWHEQSVLLGGWRGEGGGGGGDGGGGDGEGGGGDGSGGSGEGGGGDGCRALSNLQAR